jgi:dTDP-4-dehydrorhamnose reductase
MILITGAGGFVGGNLLKARPDTVACPSLKGLCEEEIKRAVLSVPVHTIIHTAAISDTKACEEDPESSYLANVTLPIYLARIAREHKIKLICFSSDQVYNGSKEECPFTEEMASPGSVYARHKLQMEERVLDILPDSVMLRAEWMYDYYLKKSNYFMNILNARDTLRFSSSVYRGVTYVKEVLENLESFIRLPGGSYNFGSETDKTIYEITKEFLELIGSDARLEDTPVGCNLLMNCQKARKYGVSFSSVTEGLKRCAIDHGYIKA